MTRLAGIGASIALFLASTAAGAVIISQTVSFPTIAPFGTFTLGNVLAGGWSANPFPIGNVSQINSIAFAFSTTDGDFVTNGGPTGGNPGVELGVLDDSSARIGLFSVNPGALTGTLTPGAVDPQMRFQNVAPLLLDGAVVLSLGAFEDLGGSSADMTLDQPSQLTITLDISPAAAPLPGTIALFALGFGLIAVRRRA